MTVISYRLWQDRFAGDPRIIGSTIRYNGIPHTIVGVLPRGAITPQAASDLFTSLQPGGSDFQPFQPGDESGGCEGHDCGILMRLKPGAPPDPRHHHVIDPQRLRQLAAAPVGGAIIGRAPGPGQNAGFEPSRALGRRPPLMAGKQARQPLLRKAGLPTSDVSRTTAQGLLDGRP